MRKFSSVLISGLFCFVFTVFIAWADPVINLNLLTPNVVCSSGNDTVRYTVSATEIPANTNIVIYQSNDSTFNPYNAQGDSIGFIPGNSIPSDTVNFGDCVKTLGIFIDACGASGQEGRNEYIILTSGNGVKVSNIAVDFSSQNNSGASNADINTGTAPCLYQTPSATLISNLQVGSCNASNVIAALPTDSIPANAIILLFTSDAVTANYGISGLCNLGYPIYVLQSACTRTIGAFTNAPRCDAPSRYRTTTVTDKRLNCSDNFTYDLCGIFDEDGTYAIRQQGTDTASVANNGIRRNAIDSCGGIDYSQLDFSADTTLKFSIPLNFCNTGYNYIKAVTNPGGSQPISNTIKYKLVCNDVQAQTSTTNICSGESAIINISSSNPNASLSWTVSGGAGISGATSGTGNSINQELSYSGNTKDSVTYTLISSDAGCTKTQAVKVVVNNCVVDACDSWLSLSDTPSGLACGDLDIVGNKVTVECMFNKLPPVYSPHLVSKHQTASAVNYAMGPLNCEITTTINGYVLLWIPCTPDSLKTYHVAMVYDGASLKYYRNGFLLASTPCSGNLITNDIVTTIGQINNATGPDYEQFKGYMNEVRIWDVARTQQELRTYMDSSLPNPSSQTGLKGYYVFDNLLNKQGNSAFNATILGTAQINQTNPQCDFVADSCNSRISICNPQITGNIPFCQGDSITLDAGSGFSSYSWNTGAITQTIKVKTAGKYVVSVTGQNNCTGKDSVEVIVNPIPQVSISGNTTFCNGSFTTLVAEVSVDSLRWNTNETSNSINVSQSGTYSVQVFQNTCSSTASVQVNIQNPPASFNLGNDTTFCGNFSKVLSTGNQTTVWSTGTTAAQITVTSAGTYIATITNACGFVSDTITLSKNELPIVNLGKDTAFCDGEIELNVSTQFRSAIWNTGATTSSITVTDEGTYSVIVTDGNGCSNSDSISITSNCANDLWIPNAFTPNGDGVNDVFLVRGNPRNTIIERFVIFNRWGNKVFEANNILPSDVTKGWDGKFKSEPEQMEVYGYEVVARFSNGEKKTLKGNVTLLK